MGRDGAYHTTAILYFSGFIAGHQLVEIAAAFFQEFLPRLVNFFNNGIAFHSFLSDGSRSSSGVTVIATFFDLLRWINLKMKSEPSGYILVK